MKPPNPANLTEKEGSLLNLEIQVMLETGAIQMMEQSQNKILSSIILVEKKESDCRRVVNLKKLTQNISYNHFEMEFLPF